MDKKRLYILLFNAVDLLLEHYDRTEIMEELGMTEREFELLGNELLCGLTTERYNQMMKSFKGKIEMLIEAVEIWGVETCNKGYDIFDFDGTGMLQIEAIGDCGLYDDSKATQDAVNDGIKIIPVDELPANFDRRYFGWIDTPENRKAIQNYCKVL